MLANERTYLIIKKTGSGALNGKMLLERIIEKIIKLLLISGQVRLDKS